MLLLEDNYYVTIFEQNNIKHRKTAIVKQLNSIIFKCLLVQTLLLVKVIEGEETLCILIWPRYNKTLHSIPIVCVQSTCFATRRCRLRCFVINAFLHKMLLNLKGITGLKGKGQQVNKIYFACSVIMHLNWHQIHCHFIALPY